MVDFNYFKENLWLSALLGGILGVIAFFTPAWSHFNSESAVVWLWNLYFSDGEFGFIDTEEALFALGIVSAVLLIIGFVILLVTGIIGKRKPVKIFNTLWLIGGILLIISPIIYLAGSEIEYSGFWTAYMVSAACILPFIAGALGLFAGITGILEQRE